MKSEYDSEVTQRRGSRRGRTQRTLPPLLCLAACGWGRPALAESPWVVHSGIGVGVHRTQYRSDSVGPGAMAPDPATSVGPGLRLAAGYRVHPAVAIGLHLGAQHIRALERIASDQYEEHRYVELEAGLGASVVVDRVSLSPWFGQQGFQDERQLAGGLTVGYDVQVVERDRVGAFASATYGSGFHMRYYGVCLGVAYRSW